MRKGIRFGLAGLLTAGLLTAGMSAAPAAFAGGGGEVIKEGPCSASSTWKLKAKPDNGRIEVEFEVDQNRNGVPWNVTLRRNGSLVASATRITHAPSGSFSFRRVSSGATGAFTAVATRSGERCTARARI
jgi:hypothetical protein